MRACNVECDSDGARRDPTSRPFTAQGDHDMEKEELFKIYDALPDEVKPVVVFFFNLCKAL